MKIAVLGGGAWGTALAVTLTHRHNTSIWLRDAVQAQTMRHQRENRRYLPGRPLPDSLEIESDIRVALQGSDLNLVATSVAGLRATLALLHMHAPRSPVCWVCKGLEAGSSKLPHQIVVEELGRDIPCGVLTGPSFAEEVARGLPTAVTFASADLSFATEMVKALNTQRLRVYANDDVIGAEVGGAVKNVMAIAAGISDGMGFGLNARAALVTRGLAEIARLGLALGARRETLMGLACLGDLVLTCTGDLSRNRRVGLGLAQGKALEHVLQELGQTAEGVSSAREVAGLARSRDIEMPITQAVTSVLYEGVAPRSAVEQLLSRDPKIE